MRDGIRWQEGEAWCEDLKVSTLAERFGTPLYLYAAGTIRRRINLIKNAFSRLEKPTKICFAVKANPNLSILKLMAASGVGADVVSLGELERALRAGIPADHIVFSGAGKTTEEIARAVEVGVTALNVESLAELTLADAEAARQNKTLRVSLRINPDVAVATHQKIATGHADTKFGIADGDVDAALIVVKRCKQLKLVGIGCHIGSQITQPEPLWQAAERMAQIARRMLDEGWALEHLDLGGGFGVQYRNEPPLDLGVLVQGLQKILAPLGLELILEPGRYLVAASGLLVTRVLYWKDGATKSFCIVDAGMNDFMRPALYDAWHEIKPVEATERPLSARPIDVVGPVCETGDVLGLDRQLPRMAPGDLLAITHTGAYGASMASRYNSRPLPAEVLVTGKEAKVIRHRETLDDLWRHEL